MRDTSQHCPECERLTDLLTAESLRADRAEAERDKLDRIATMWHDVAQDAKAENAQLRAQVERVQPVVDAAYEEMLHNHVSASLEAAIDTYRAVGDYEHEMARIRVKLTAESLRADRAEAQVERMQPVVDEALAVGTATHVNTITVGEFLDLKQSAASYRAGTQESDNPMTPSEFYTENPELTGEEAGA